MYLYSTLQNLQKDISICFINFGKFISILLSQCKQLRKIRIASICDINIKKQKSNCHNSDLNQKTIDQIVFINSLDKDLKKNNLIVNG